MRQSPCMYSVEPFSRGREGCREALSETHLPRFPYSVTLCVLSQRSNGGAFALSPGVGFSYHTRRRRQNRGEGQESSEPVAYGWLPVCWSCPASMGSVCEVLYDVLAQGLIPPSCSRVLMQQGTKRSAGESCKKVS